MAFGIIVVSIAITPASIVIIIAIMLEASMKKNTKLLHLIASKVNYMRRTSITCQHAGRYTIMGQPQPGCVSRWRRSQNSLHTDHHMILRPYHSHHTLQKQVKRRTYIFYHRGMINRYQQTATAQSNIDHIYRIAMKISSDWSNQTDLGHSQCPLFSLVNHIDYRDRYIG